MKYSIELAVDQNYRFFGENPDVQVGFHSRSGKCFWF